MVASEPLRYHLDLQSPWCDHFLRTDPALANTPCRRTHQGYAQVGVFTIKLWELDDIQLQKIKVVGGHYNEMMYNNHDPSMVEEFQVCPNTIPMPSKKKPSSH